jgi:hypothetical protein
MAVTKKDQERATYAWMYGSQARKDGKERAVPDLLGPNRRTLGFRASNGVPSAMSRSR